MLDPRRLRLLQYVARTGSIAGAAEQAGCTPSAASQQLSALERDLGTALLERSARSVRLTEAGRVLVEHSGRVLDELDAAEQAVLDVAGLRGGQLRLAAFSSATNLIVPALRSFRQLHPQIRLSLVELEPEEAIPAVAGGEIDLAVTHQYKQLPRPDLRGLRQHLLDSDQLLLAVPPHLRTAQRSAVRLSDYAGATWLSPRPAEGFQAVTELVCRAAGFEPDVAFRADSYDLLLALVAADFGLALVPSLVAAPQPGIAFLHIAEPAGLTREVHATARSADNSPAVQAMTQLLLRK
ncbi:LysR family transcriptional regulator [Streptomyces sp. Wb2n-11]|uniref:LysR family transcriptional regulator n=1 Tax=Streptomyces sp. Wb2n-11 TaxID=1030533 RepID=UPI000A9D7B3B|nr:LysR substrate-binding domain-containing protein [Streptomyces sp. Wb2n-11]